MAAKRTNRGVRMTDASRTRHIAVELTVLAAHLVADAIWRWQDAKYAARSGSARFIQRWAHRHGL